MVRYAAAVLWALAAAAAATAAAVANSGAVNKFPDGFLLGAASAAYQIEGAWNEDGKGENIWDHMFHEHPEYAHNGENGDVACDSYHKYAEDVEALKGIGATAYRFSISWSRVLPTGDLDVINQAGIDYYNNIINLLLENGIEPMVTMYHWDLPQALQYIGGWPNPLMVDYFVEYARLLFDTFGDRVKWWTTINEPYIVACGYSSSGWQAPSQNAPGIGNYLAAHTMIRAHARVYRLYEQEYRATQNGKVGIALNSDWYEPAEDTDSYLEAQERMFQFQLGLYAHPILLDGDYPAVVRQRVDNNSAAEGRPRSRLPSFTEEEKQYIKGSADFIGINTYTTTIVEPGDSGGVPSFELDTGVIRYQNESWPGSSASWLKVVPWGFRKLLNWMSNEYPGYPIVVTENGYGDWGELDDQRRIDYYGSYLAELLKAINEDGVNILGYMAWSIMDNLEWASGYELRFGIYRVDFNSTDLARIPKASASFMGDIFRNKTVPDEYFQ
ncbi:myrosinase 1-like [Schistocerca gregaria]|uniref:myrosinase 1-like n=1 Tax=Schistocerca gregaria TaxID=7010 RepID=UPI00211E7DC5|nr:myrosinase 1-like [Schistocerca gregaria]